MQLGIRVNLRSFNRALLDRASVVPFDFNFVGRTAWPWINHLASFVQLKCKSRYFFGVYHEYTRRTLVALAVLYVATA